MAENVLRLSQDKTKVIGTEAQTLNGNLQALTLKEDVNVTATEKSVKKNSVHSVQIKQFFNIIGIRQA